MTIGDTCKLELYIPFKEMAFYFNKPYPKGKKSKENVFSLIKNEKLIY